MEKHYEIQVSPVSEAVYPQLESCLLRTGHWLFSVFKELAHFQGSYCFEFSDLFLNC